LIFAGILIALAGYPQILTRRSTVGEALQAVPWNLASGALLALFLLLGTSRWKRFATPTFLTFFGNISYGLYLYHVMFFRAYDWFTLHGHVPFALRLDLWTQMWVRAFLAISVSVAFSYLSRRYLEGPFLRLKSVFSNARPAQSASPASEVVSSYKVLPSQTEDTPAGKLLR
jgi:peptidoglycan/LPS O-acetylase OafA/YrhL